MSEFKDKNGLKIKVGDTGRVDMSFNRNVHGRSGQVLELAGDGPSATAKLSISGMSPVTILLSYVERTKLAGEKSGGGKPGKKRGGGHRHNGWGGDRNEPRIAGGSVSFGPQSGGSALGEAMIAVIEKRKLRR